ncbi:phosphoribosylamine--glycine ligase [Corynebacterium atypicum]|uniref:Phosphoribosylamine--glycine ligase n=1 Tax=Corynebacterium atypicum TaxID=191610 RepID=A0ABN4DGJ1_9CORY|nr:phosphoribosylamine--glycine ligase [Corynebacterium atypicum]AIG64657.1 phosphoribosylamine--glycine ligase [Corynebacterium atypicum]
MRILVLGAGGREHALLKAMRGAQSGESHELHAAPGNAGIAQLATCHELSVTDAKAVVELAESLAPDLVVIGPEAPLVAGVSDALRAAGVAVFGPSAEAAKIEGSKAFAKDVMRAAGVATARAQRIEPAAGSSAQGPGDGADVAARVDRVLDAFGPHFVVKDDGLAGGKGVVVTDSRAQAADHARAVLAAGNPVLVEEFLAGPEVSLFCLVDGEEVVPLIPAQDHKRAFDGDHGPNTGGMGAYSPLPWLPEGAVERIVAEVCRPVARELARRGTPYSGLLYAGLVWGEAGPAVIEFNARFGDPETQNVLALLQTPLAEVLRAVATGHLADLPALEWESGSAVTVVLAAPGYPGAPRKGGAITGIPQDTAQAYVLHSGTARDPEGRLVAAGGRVLSVVGKGADFAAARRAAYEVVERIGLEGSFYRRDIGKAMAQMEQ